MDEEIVRAQYVRSSTKSLRSLALRHYSGLLKLNDLRPYYSGWMNLNEGAKRAGWQTGVFKGEERTYHSRYSDENQLLVSKRSDLGEERTG